jgi:hypothetical protein
MKMFSGAHRKQSGQHYGNRMDVINMKTGVAICRSFVIKMTASAQWILSLPCASALIFKWRVQAESLIEGFQFDLRNDIF